MMRTLFLVLVLCFGVGTFLSPTFSQVNNPQNPNASLVQGPDPTGNQGYPFAVAPATGSAWTVNQGMPPWTVSQSGAWIVDINSFPGSPLAVTQSTNPWVVDASGFPVPVTGTFWQATQPVSGPLTDTQLRATPVPVSGTFWQATQPVSGTVTANAGTGTFTVGGTVTANAGTGTFTVDASGHTVPISAASLPLPTGAATETTLAKVPLAQGSTTSGQSGALVQGAVTTAAPTYTTAQTSPLSLNTAGGLRVDGSGVTQPVSGTVTANAGSGTFTVGGTVTANAGTGTFTVDGSGHTQPVSGTVTANAGTGTFTVDASGHTVPVSAATLPLPTGAATEASLTKIPLAQGSTTSGQSGALIQGAVTTAAPSYTTAQTSPLSLNTSGGLRVDGSGVTQPVSGTVTANAGSGTFAVSGTVTANAGTGTFTVDGSGHTQPVSGTVTANAGTGNFTVIGPTAPGAAIAQAPVLIAGENLGNVKLLHLNSLGGPIVDQGTGGTSAWKVDGSAVTQPISGTVTANAGSGTFAISNANEAQVVGVVSGYTTSDITTTASTAVVTGVAAKNLYITQILVTNMSSSVDTRVDLQDGSGGTAIYGGFAAHGGGGFSISLPYPGLKVPTSGNGLFAVCGTTGAQVRVSAAGTSR